jgi:hypothetical protein
LGDVIWNNVGTNKLASFFVLLGNNEYFGFVELWAKKGEIFKYEFLLNIGTDLYRELKLNLKMKVTGKIIIEETGMEILSKLSVGEKVCKNFIFFFQEQFEQDLHT